jgi:hypothetical protein
VKFYGVTAEGFQCTVDVPAEKLSSGVEIIQESISVHCTRSGPQTVKIGGQDFLKVPRGTIAVRTAANPFLLSFNEETTPALPKAAEDRLSALVQQMATKVTNLEAELNTAKSQIITQGTEIAANISRSDAVAAFVPKSDESYVKYSHSFAINYMADTGRCIKGAGGSLLLQNEVDCNQFWKLLKHQ